MKYWCLAAIAGVVCALGSHAAPQDGPSRPQATPAPQSDVPIYRVETRLINVPINVTDAHGAAIGDLQQKDFAVREDGKLQKIALFERESATPLSIEMAIDTSGSVLSQLKTEKEAAKRFAQDLLREQDEMGLIAFSDESEELVSFTNDPKRIEQGLNHLSKGDDTALYNAIYVASQRLSQAKPDAERRRVLVLITDGGDNPTKREMSYSRAVEQAQRAGAAIYPIIIVPILADAGRNVGGEHALIQMANDTGGKYFYVTDREDLKTAFAHLSDELRTQYLLGYYAPRRGQDTSFRRIDVSLTDPAVQAKARLRYRTGYYADAR